MAAGNASVQRLTIQQIIASGNIDAVTGRAPVSAAAFHGVSGAHDLSENWPVKSGLTPLAPNWVYSRVRVQQTLYFQEFSEVMHEVTGWGSRDQASKHGQGSAVWRALGHMASQPTDTSGSYQLREMFKGLCSQMPVRDGIGRALEGSRSMTKTFLSVLKPHVSGSDTNIAFAVMGSGASNYAGVSVTNCAARKNIFTTLFGSTKNSGSTMHSGGITSARVSAAGRCVKDSLRDIMGLHPTGITGVSANLMKASVMALEGAPCREHVVNHALHLAAAGSRTTLYITRFRKASLGMHSLCALNPNPTCMTDLPAIQWSICDGSKLRVLVHRVLSIST